MSHRIRDAGSSFPCLKLPSESATPELVKLGEKTVTSFADGSKASLLCQVRYPALRDNLLRDHVWAFAKKKVELPPIAGDSDIVPWEFRFQLPADLARLLEISVDDQEVPFEQVGTVLYANNSPLDLRYVSNFSTVDDAFAFPDDFAEALANLLAAELAMAITQTQSLRDTYLGMYQDRITQARFNGAVERRSISVTASSWLDAHDGGCEIDPSRRGLSGY